MSMHLFPQISAPAAERSPIDFWNEHPIIKENFKPGLRTRFFLWKSSMVRVLMEKHAGRKPDRRDSFGFRRPGRLKNSKQE